jgi:pantoate--beta-alanine ligase
VREEDGLAKSSRNVYLSESERAEAPAIFASLNLAKAHFTTSKDAEAALQAAKDHIAQNTSGKIDYIEFLSYPDLAEINEATTKYLLAAAVYIGKTRLIDNLIFSLKGDEDHV